MLLEITTQTNAQHTINETSENYKNFIEALNEYLNKNFPMNINNSQNVLYYYDTIYDTTNIYFMKKLGTLWHSNLPMSNEIYVKADDINLLKSAFSWIIVIPYIYATENRCPITNNVTFNFFHTEKKLSTENLHVGKYFYVNKILLLKALGMELFVLDKFKKYYPE